MNQYKIIAQESTESWKPSWSTKKGFSVDAVLNELHYSAHSHKCAHHDSIFVNFSFKNVFLMDIARDKSTDELLK